MANETGTIGQMYENRKSKKVGVIESRDEKCKTLMMRDSEGKTFNVTYSTFKSNWRKYVGDEKIETSTQKEEKKAKVKDAEKKLEKKPKAPKVDIKEKIEIIESEKEVIQPIIEKCKKFELNLRSSSKGGIIIKIGRSTIFEVWNDYRANLVNICLREDVKEFLNYSAKTGEVSEEFKDNYILKWVLTINKNKLANLVSDIVKAIEQLPEKNEKEDK